MRVKVEHPTSQKKEWKRGDILINKTFGNIVIFLEKDGLPDRFVGIEIYSPADSINNLIPDMVWATSSFELFHGVITLSNN